jgi:thymidylate kinase
MKGIIVFEGLDCSGKTTAIRNLMEDLNSNQIVYNKGIGSATRIGKIARKLPSTFMFALEILLNQIIRIKHLKENKIILQDRYDISISSFVPLSKRFYNQGIIFLMKLFLIKPLAIIYFHLPLEERIRRLKEKNTEYELILAKNPSKIIEREKEYEKWFQEFKGMKLKIDTHKNSILEVNLILKEFCRKLFKDCSSMNL